MSQIAWHNRRGHACKPRGMEYGRHNKESCKLYYNGASMGRKCVSGKLLKPISLSPLRSPPLQAWRASGPSRRPSTSTRTGSETPCPGSGTNLQKKYSRCSAGGRLLRPKWDIWSTACKNVDDERRGRVDSNQRLTRVVAVNCGDWLTRKVTFETNCLVVGLRLVGTEKLPPESAESTTIREGVQRHVWKTCLSLLLHLHHWGRRIVKKGKTLWISAMSSPYIQEKTYWCDTDEQSPVSENITEHHINVEHECWTAFIFNMSAMYWTRLNEHWSTVLFNVQWLFLKKELDSRKKISLAECV